MTRKENPMAALTRYVLATLIVLSPALAYAECPDDAAVAAFVADYHAGRMSKALAGVTSLADGECGRAKLVKELARTEGAVLGYKVAVTSPAQQKATGLSAPAWGVM